MSNIDNTVESVTDTPVVDGQVDANAETGEAFEAEPREYFAWDEYADKPVKLTVDGEEIEVPLSEALSGYQRQADYTRKTQELAEQRRQVQFAAALQEALQNDPASTVELLSQHYGVNQNQHLKRMSFWTQWRSSTANLSLGFKHLNRRRQCEN